MDVTGDDRYLAVVRAAARTVVGLDFDGVLSPIVPDPASAVIHPDGPDVLVELAARVRAVAVITGRPAQQAVRLGRLDEVADRLPEGARLLVLGQYGNERWDSADRRFSSPEAPPGLVELRAELPALLGEHDAADAYVEDKQIAVAVHTRRLADPQAAFERLLPAVTEAARRHGLDVEPGRFVLEVRAPGMHKGEAVRALHDELGADGFVFAGDDLGDVEAFRAVAALREAGHPTLLVCSGSEEQQALVELADVVVDGPDGVMGLLRRLAGDAGGAARHAGDAG
ncbi:MAG TPA: trehalose-phosphatase [Nocardioidaceae bacterium]|jgi:trehalose 6-phosphate phosphatase|nr:trehalose-phosphatase [Nocardioidaceae bacterium]